MLAQLYTHAIYTNTHIYNIICIDEKITNKAELNPCYTGCGYNKEIPQTSSPPTTILPLLYTHTHTHRLTSHIQNDY